MRLVGFFLCLTHANKYHRYFIYKEQYSQSRKALSLSRDANLQSPVRYYETNGHKNVLEVKHGCIFSRDLGGLLLAGKSVIFIVNCFLCVSHHVVTGYLLVYEFS